MLKPALALLALSACTQAAEPVDTPQSRAALQARETLAQSLHVAIGEIRVSSIEARTWSDSGLGCSAPGAMVATVITEGYAVTAMAQGRLHLVHVSGKNAVVCDKGGVVLREPPAARGAGLDVMMEKARKDLAARLGVEAAHIRIGGLRAGQWPDSGLGCPQQDEKLSPGPVDGLVISLKHAGRVYTYHTDRKTVRACPAIETE
ncbi:MAG: hypothetical protein AB7P31_05525 [Steroidobacteraceae bacterium]